MILKLEANNPKFNFLRSEDDPYRPYYARKLEELTTGKIFEDILPPEQPQKGQVVTSSIAAAPGKRENPFQKQLRELIYSGDPDERKATGDVRPYAPDQFNVSHPVLANVDSDVIKLTAQFVAKNGQRFLQGLTEREQRNPQFDFLKPTHGLFGYFT